MNPLRSCRIDRRLVHDIVKKKARDEHHVPGLNEIMGAPSSPVVWFQHFCFVFVFLINIWIYTRGLWSCVSFYSFMWDHVKNMMWHHLIGGYKQRYFHHILIKFNLFFIILHNTRKCEKLILFHLDICHCFTNGPWMSGLKVTRSFAIHNTCLLDFKKIHNDRAAFYHYKSL